MQHAIPGSNLEFTSVDVGNPAGNVYPRAGACEIQHPIQRQPHPGDAARIAGGAAGESLRKTASTPASHGSRRTPTCSSPSPAVHRPRGLPPSKRSRPQAGALDLGRTSDARFISGYCRVIEFGLVGQTMHQIDERARCRTWRS